MRYAWYDMDYSAHYICVTEGRLAPAESSPRIVDYFDNVLRKYVRVPNN